MIYIFGKNINLKFYNLTNNTMNQTLDEKLTKLVIMGCHPECKTYEEAKRKYLTRGAFLIGNGISYGVVLDDDFNGKVCYAHGNQTRIIKIDEAMNVLQIPITLPRILEVISNNKKNIIDSYSTSNAFYFSDKKLSKKHIMWKLTKDGIDCTPENQSQETKEKLLELLS